MKAKNVDMSPLAVARRLDKIRGLYDLMKYLGQFTPLVEAAEQARARKSTGD